MHSLERTGPEKWHQEFSELDSSFPELRVSSSSSLPSVPLSHSLSTPFAIYFNFFRKKIHIKLNFLMWVSVFSKIITSVHIKVACIMTCFSSNFYILPHLIRAILMSLEIHVRLCYVLLCMLWYVMLC